MKYVKRFLPLFIIIGLTTAIFFSNWSMYFTFDMLKQHDQDLMAFVHKHPFMTPLLFIGFYTLSTTLSLPIGIFLGILSGFLFPQPWCTVYVLIAATLGATFVLLIARLAIGDFLIKKAGPFIKRLEEGFKEGAVSYMLFLRLVPIFPFWLVNLVPAFLKIPLKTYIWTTAVGIAPAVFVNAQVGRGLEAILMQGESFTLSSLFNMKIKIALIALGVVALIPVILKKIRKKIS